jgi:hypothetical protein
VRKGGEDDTYIDKLMHIFDVDLVATNPADEIHETKLGEMRMVRSRQGGKLTYRSNDAVIRKLFPFGERTHAQKHLEEKVNGI